MQFSNSWRASGVVALCLLNSGVSPCGVLRAQDSSAAPAPTSPASEQSLFNGKDFGDWKQSEFGGSGEVYIEDGLVLVDQGEELSGFHWTQSFPVVNYEFEVQAQRRSGLDFFCGLTFPVVSKHVSLILGGWGGATCGVSSINGLDDSKNETTFQRNFSDRRWYTVRVRVEADRLRAWLDGERIVDLDTRGKALDLRAGEIEGSKPLGLATFRTGAAFRGMKLRQFSAAERTP
ncbi:MAG: DUF1080 domain-containing protein [Verrucomicrobiota bacterium]